MRTSNQDAILLADRFLSAGDLVWIGPSEASIAALGSVRPEEAEGRPDGRTASPHPETSP